MKAIGELVIAHICNDEVKAKMVDKINDSIDIPFLRESTEEKIFSALWDVVEDCIKEVVLED